MKTIFITLLALGISIPLLAQGKKELVDLTFETSITCDNCVNTIMGSLPHEKGVKNVKCDLETKEVKVTIRKDKTDEELVRRALEKLGYTARKTKEEVTGKAKKRKEAED